MASPGIYLTRVAVTTAMSLLIGSLAFADSIPSEGLVLWLDGADPDGDRLADNNPADGQNLTKWIDKSGQMNHVEQKSTDRQPKYQRGVLNSRSVVRFSGKHAFEQPKFRGIREGDRPFYAVFVMKATMVAPHSNPRLLDLRADQPGEEADVRRGFWVGYQNNGRNRLGIAHGDEGEAETVSWNGKANLLEVAYEGNGRWAQFFNGQTNGRGVFTDRTFLGFRQKIRLAIGQHYGITPANTFYAGDLAEVLLYNRVLSSPEQNTLGAYLSQKYRLDTPYGPMPRFEKDIAPILAQHCHACHGDDEQEAKLDLRTVSAMLRGGKSGAALVRGYPDRSEMLEMIVSGKMPTKDEPRLADEEVALVRRWIKLGAPADEKVTLPTADALVSDKDRAHWAFQKLARLDPPRVKASNRVCTPVDAFILRRLEDQSLALSPEADHTTLARRAWFDLIGLPPSPEDLAQFEKESIRNPNSAFRDLVDRLLDSPHFGERWGRHWLDSAGYVDVYGGDNDAKTIKPLEDKWRYRDYVVQSFNEDKPFDRFLTEQLAGDELYDWRNADSFTPEIRDALIATGFLLCAADSTDSPELNTPDIRHRVLQMTGEIVASNLLALTVNCAKCHNHKYEAIPQLDYYRWTAAFSPAFNPEKWVTSNKHAITDVAPKEKSDIDRRNGEIDRDVKELLAKRDELRRGYELKLRAQKLATISESIRADAEAALDVPADKRNKAQKDLAKEFGPRLAVAGREIDEALSPNDRAKIESLNLQVVALNSQRRRYGTIQVIYEHHAPSPTFLLRRGNYLKLGMEVKSGLLTVLAAHQPNAQATGERAEPQPNHSSGRRLALARQLTDPNKPASAIVARVMVNRIWQHLFGNGLVETSDNFGVSGAKPTHPDLLNWLAAKWINDGWKTKPIIKMLMTSSVYRQASADNNNVKAIKVDPGNRLLWRMPLRRLESEIIRDAILAASGKLDRAIGGRPLDLEVRADGKVVLKDQNIEMSRRSLYVLARRNYQLSILNTFDQPQVATNCTRRLTSAVVSQPLTMLNDDFVLRHANLFSERVAAASGDSSEKRITAAFKVAFGRSPVEQEMQWSTDLLHRHTERYEKQGMNQQQAARHALTHLCHMLINANEFLYLH
jgi:hypothetical protein